MKVEIMGLQAPNDGLDLPHPNNQSWHGNGETLPSALQPALYVPECCQSSQQGAAFPENQDVEPSGAISWEAAL